MEATTPNSSPSPTPASTDGRHSPPPRNSMEDADSSVTRKRPRLDSGIRAHQNITSPFFATVDADNSRGTEPTSPDLHDSSSRLPDAQEHQARRTMGTPSKVTLNLRDPQQPRSPTTLRSLDTSYSPHTSDTSSTMSHRPSPDPDATDSLATPVHNVLPENEQDVHIEISDPEDIGTAGYMDTRQFVSKEDCIAWQHEHLAQFPTQSSISQSWEQEIRDILGIAIQEPGGLARVLPKLADWIQIYLAQTRRMSQHWSALLVQERSFWSSLPTIVSFMCGDRFVSASSQRNIDSVEATSALDALLQAFIDLTARMVAIDHNTLSKTKDVRTFEPVIVSVAYIHALHRIFNAKAENRPLRALERLGASMSAHIKQIACGSGSEPGILPSLGDCLPLLLARPLAEGASPKLLQATVSFPSDLCCLWQKAYRTRSTSAHDGLSASLQNLVISIITNLRRAVKKQSPALSGDLLVNLFMTHIQSWIVFSMDLTDGLLREYIPADRDSWQVLSVHDQSQLAMALFKLDLFQRCVREGRMEIRIAGLEALQQGLIDVYNIYIRGRLGKDQQHPVIELISAQLLQTKLVDYILSVDSHPQIISRAGNIIGFLAVSGKWTGSQTDLIWESVRATEDQRVFETIIDMLNNVTKFLDYPDLTHFITRMRELSVSHFDVKVQKLLILVCGQTIEKGSGEPDLVIVLMQTFTMLLRSASSDTAVSLGQKRHMWDTMQTGFRQLAAVEWPSEARMQIYRDCCQDLEAHSTGTSGSCAIIRQLLERHACDDVAMLSNHMDAANLVVNDFERLGHLQAVTATDFERFGTPVEDRLRILELMVLQLPQSVPPDLARRLWSSMFAEKTVGPVARELIWDMLARLAVHSKSSNTFLDQCIDEHLPSLDPALYSRSTLNFANCVLGYENRTRTTPVSGHETDVETRASVNLFWQLALDAEDDFVSNKACQALIDQANSQTRAESDFSRELRLIEKAIDQLVSIGNQLRNQDNMEKHVVTATVLHRRYRRLFTMLGQFVATVQVNSPNSPSTRSDSQKSSSSSVGERVQIQYTTSDRGKPGPKRSIELNENDTVEDFMSKLRVRTGFSKFNVIIGGVRLDQEQLATETLASLGFHRKGPLIVHRIPGTDLLRTSSGKGCIRPVDAVIMHRFDKLYELLTAPVFIAYDVLKLLRSFGPHADVLQLVTNVENGQEEVLPMQHPCKASYSLHAIEARHRVHLSEGSLDLDFMKHSVKLLCDAIFVIELPTTDQSARVHLNLLEEILSVLLMLLKEPVSPDCSDAFFAEPVAFVKKLHEICGLVEALLGSPSMKVVQSCFACLLEASTISDSVWEAFRAHESSPGLFSRLILLNPDTHGRTVTYKTIMSVLSTLSGKLQSSKTLDKQQEASSPRQAPLRFAEIIEHLWKLSRDLIVEAATTTTSSRCQQFFSLALSLFSTVDESVHDASLLQGYIESWTQLLIQYDSQHHVGRDVTDWAVKGLSDLLHQAMILLKNRGIDPLIRPDFSEQMFDALLFPPIRELDTRDSGRVTASVLGSQTRMALYKVVLRTAIDTGNSAKPLRLLTAVLNDEHTQQLPTSGLDRTKSMRTSAGYPGLENLSNTCYLNSLMTQLFMNLPFRGFILRQEVHDPAAQALLLAMQRLFANLQDGWQKSVCTRELANSIQTYDGPLDPTIQMDADEAFNLLFDRLESQLSDISSRAAFKRLFGGQIIQQIKSKECEHVSERFEPITAVQCDIQGRQSLNQSLDAYIEGENMEGDNKYKCSKCDRYVTAVKRACLKDIPDNLIFHLKRFDFDLLSGSRSKVNDLFEFPLAIDMSPYTIDSLEDNAQGVGSDDFILVGVLVHNGNAEVGHYYSYMRERPASSGTWVEFNDSEVSHFDQNMLSDQCFGGTTENFQQQTFPKVWNAYMLFYQRKSALQAEQGSLTRQLEQPLIRAHVNQRISAEIAMHNEVMARTFCLTGQEHMVFVRELLTALLRKRGSRCSDDHMAEDIAIECAWTHIEKVFAKETKRPGTHDAVSFLETMIGSCSRCCLSSLRWTLAIDETRLRNVLIRPIDPDLRTKVVDLTIRCIVELGSNLPAEYSLNNHEENDDIEMSDENKIESEHGVFAQLLDRLSDLQPVVALNYRAWPEYYRLLCAMSRFGPKERAWMREIGFLQYSLEVLLIDSHHDWAARYPGKHSHYIRLIEKRTYDLSGLMELIMLLLEDLQVESSSAGSVELDDSGDRLFFLTHAERSALSIKLTPEGGDLPVPWVLERAATANCMRSRSRPLQALTRFVLRNENALKLQKGVLNIISHGIVKNPADLATPYLLITLELLRTDIPTALVEHIIQLVADGVKTIGDSGGAQHLEFFRRALQNQEDGSLSGQPRQVKMAVIRNCPIWGSVLLEYPEIDVTQGCSNLLNQILFDLPPGDEEDEEVAEIRAEAAQVLWTEIRQLIQKYARENQALDESKKPLLNFSGCCLAQRLEVDPRIADGCTGQSFTAQDPHIC